MGTRPRVAAGAQTKPDKPLGKKPKGKKSPAKKQVPQTPESGGYQSIVTVVDGEAQVAKEELDAAVERFGLKKDGRTRLLRVAVALAAFDVWDSMNPDEARKLFHALAAAVRS